MIARFFIGFLSVPVLLAISIFWGGWVTSILWAWFIVPLGVMPINYWHAVGIGCVVAAFLGTRGMYDGPEDKDPDVQFGIVMVRSFARVTLIPAMLLGMGYLIHINMPVPA